MLPITVEIVIGRPSVSTGMDISASKVNFFKSGIRFFFFLAIRTESSMQLEILPNTVARAAPKTSHFNTRINSASNTIFNKVPSILGIVASAPSPSARIRLP